ncbi:hypothetical protein EPN16_00280, partial [bacterium]
MKEQKEREEDELSGIIRRFVSGIDLDARLAILYDGDPEMRPFDFKMDFCPNSRNAGLAGFLEALRVVMYRHGRLYENFQHFLPYIHGVLKRKHNREILEWLERLNQSPLTLYEKHKKMVHFLELFTAALSASVRAPMGALSLADLGAEVTPENKVISRNGLKKAAELLPVLARSGVNELYLNWLFEVSGLSKKVHQVPTSERHFIPEGPATIRVEGYATKRKEMAGTVFKDDGNNFSIYSMFRLNPQLSDGNVEEDLKDFIDKANSLGIKIIVDLIPVISPDGVSAGNYRFVLHKNLGRGENKRWLQSTPEQKEEFIKEVLLRPGNDKFAAIRIDEDGKQKIILARHLAPAGTNVDQVVLNMLLPQAQAYFIDAGKRLIDMGVSGFRVDLPHEHLKKNIRRNYFDLLTPEQKILLEAGEEPWGVIIRQLKTYAKEKGRQIEFIMETYTYIKDDQRDLLGLAADEVYHENVFKDYEKVARGGAPAYFLLGSLKHALENKPKLVIFPTNFDQISLKEIDGPKRSFAMLLIALKHLGVPVMVDITRDWIDFSGHIKPMAGGAEGTLDAHPFVSEEELNKRRDFAGLKNEIAHGFWARQIERFYKAIAEISPEKVEASAFLNTSRPDETIALAWKTESRHWVVLAASLKPHGKRSGSVDVYLPEGISRNHSVKDALNPQDELRLNESREGSYSLQLKFDHKDYKILLLSPPASSPILLPYSSTSSPLIIQLGGPAQFSNPTAVNENRKVPYYLIKEAWHLLDKPLLEEREKERLRQVAGELRQFFRYPSGLVRRNAALALNLISQRFPQILPRDEFEEIFEKFAVEDTKEDIYYIERAFLRGMFLENTLRGVFGRGFPGADEFSAADLDFIASGVSKNVYQVILLSGGGGGSIPFALSVIRASPFTAEDNFNIEPDGSMGEIYNRFREIRELYSKDSGILPAPGEIGFFEDGRVVYLERHPEDGEPLELPNRLVLMSAQWIDSPTLEDILREQNIDDEFKLNAAQRAIASVFRMWYATQTDDGLGWTIVDPHPANILVDPFSGIGRIVDFGGLRRGVTLTDVISFLGGGIEDIKFSPEEIYGGILLGFGLEEGTPRALEARRALEEILSRVEAENTSSPDVSRTASSPVIYGAEKKPFSGTAKGIFYFAALAAIMASLHTVAFVVRTMRFLRIQGNIILSRAGRMRIKTAAKAVFAEWSRISPPVLLRSAASEGREILRNIPAAAGEEFIYRGIPLAAYTLLAQLGFPITGFFALAVLDIGLWYYSRVSVPLPHLQRYHGADLMNNVLMAAVSGIAAFTVPVPSWAWYGLLSTVFIVIQAAVLRRHGRFENVKRWYMDTPRAQVEEPPLFVEWTAAGSRELVIFVPGLMPWAIWPYEELKALNRDISGVVVYELGSRPALAKLLEQGYAGGRRLSSKDRGHLTEIRSIQDSIARSVAFLGWVITFFHKRKGRRGDAYRVYPAAYSFGCRMLLLLLDRHYAKTRFSHLPRIKKLLKQARRLVRYSLLVSPPAQKVLKVKPIVTKAYQFSLGAIQNVPDWALRIIQEWLKSRLLRRLFWKTLFADTFLNATFGTFDPAYLWMKLNSYTAPDPVSRDIIARTLWLFSHVRLTEGEIRRIRAMFSRGRRDAWLIVSKSDQIAPWAGVEELNEMLRLPIFRTIGGHHLIYNKTFLALIRLWLRVVAKSIAMPGLEDITAVQDSLTDSFEIRLREGHYEYTPPAAGRFSREQNRFLEQINTMLGALGKERPQELEGLPSRIAVSFTLADTLLRGGIVRIQPPGRLSPVRLIIYAGIFNSGLESRLQQGLLYDLLISRLGKGLSGLAAIGSTDIFYGILDRPYNSIQRQPAGSGAAPAASSSPVKSNEPAPEAGLEHLTLLLYLLHSGMLPHYIYSAESGKGYRFTKDDQDKLLFIVKQRLIGKHADDAEIGRNVREAVAEHLNEGEIESLQVKLMALARAKAPEELKKRLPQLLQNQELYQSTLLWLFEYAKSRKFSLPVYAIAREIGWLLDDYAQAGETASRRRIAEKILIQLKMLPRAPEFGPDRMIGLANELETDLMSLPEADTLKDVQDEIAKLRREADAGLQKRQASRPPASSSPLEGSQGEPSESVILNAIIELILNRKGKAKKGGAVRPSLAMVAKKLGVAPEALADLIKNKRLGTWDEYMIKAESEIAEGAGRQHPASADIIARGFIDNPEAKQDTLPQILSLFFEFDAHLQKGVVEAVFKLKRDGRE